MSKMRDSGSNNLPLMDKNVATCELQIRWLKGFQKKKFVTLLSLLS